MGANFTVSVASRTVYQSPPLTHYRYSDNRSLYSPPVQITIGSLAIAVPANASDAHISFVFNNNARNVQLLLPLNLTVSCASGPCLTAPLWEPSQTHVVFRSGEVTQPNGTTCPCFRVPALVRSKDTLMVRPARNDTALGGRAAPPISRIVARPSTTDIYSAMAHGLSRLTLSSRRHLVVF